MNLVRPGPSPGLTLRSIRKTQEQESDEGRNNQQPAALMVQFYRILHNAGKGIVCQDAKEKKKFIKKMINTFLPIIK